MGFTPPKKQPEFASLKGILSQIKASDPALYQTIQILIERLMQFQGITVQDIANINASVNSINSVINIVADKFRTYITEIDESLNLPNSRKLTAGTNITFDVTNPNELIINAVLTALSNLDFLTHSDESVALPNSRQLLAGTNITFDDTVANQRTINAAGGSGDDYVVLSDGASGVTPPGLIHDGAGNFIYVAYTP